MSDSKIVDYFGTAPAPAAETPEQYHARRLRKCLSNGGVDPLTDAMSKNVRNYNARKAEEAKAKDVGQVLGKANGAVRRQISNRFEGLR